jgi:hypothetical protein
VNNIAYPFFIMAKFEVGNRFWELAENAGRPKLYETAEQLWSYACEYFVWCADNPLYETQIHGKDAVECVVPKMRAMTIRGLCVFLGIDEDTFLNYEKMPDFFGIISRIRGIIWCQKFEGAGAGLLNANIISRELGLADKTSVNATIKLGKELEDDYE